MGIKVDIVSAEGAIWSGDSEIVIVSAQAGEVGILKGHAPLLTRIKPGNVIVRRADGETLNYYVSGGILEVQPDLVTILSDTVIRAQDLDEAALLEAKKKAEEALKHRKEKLDYAVVESQLIENLRQLSAIERYKNDRK